MAQTLSEPEWGWEELWQPRPPWLEPRPFSGLISDLSSR